MSRQFLCLSVALAVLVPSISIRADALGHWTSTQLSTNSFGLNLLVYGNGRYVAAGGMSDGGALMSSEDGLSWILRADGGCCGPPSLVYGLTYGGGRFVAVGHFGGTASSSDGINWSFANVQSGALNDVAYGAGIYAAVGSADFAYFDNIFSSADGFTWTARHSDPTEQRSISGVAYGAGKFVAIGANDGFTYTSSTGTNWTRRSIPGGSRICFCKNIFIVPLGSGTNLLSADGINWAAFKTGIPNLLSRASLINGLFVATTSTRFLALSTDGTNWIQRSPSPIPGASSVVPAGARLVTVGRTNTVSYYYDSFGFASEPFAGLLQIENTLVAPQLTALGLPAGSYRLEYATNLSPTNPVNWQPLVPFSAPPNSQSFVDATATNSLSRFYRLVLLP